MLHMRFRPSANAVVRTALAVLFGFMSLFHGTVMAFAKPDPAGHHGMPAQHVVMTGGHAGGHHHQAGHQQQSSHAIPDAVPSCYGVGCFIALDCFAVASPEADFRPIATLSPSIARAMLPTSLDPVVPPPRIQV